jgi:hypothetical protein
MGSTGIKEYAFADDSGRERSLQMQLHLEVPSWGDENVPRDSKVTNSPVSPSASQQSCWGIVGHDHHDVIVASGPASPRAAEQGRSYSGKSTLVRELIRAGATYPGITIAFPRHPTTPACTKTLCRDHSAA